MKYEQKATPPQELGLVLFFCYNLYMQTKIIERYFFFFLLFITFVFSFFIFRPFLMVLVLSISFSIVLYPVYEWFNKRKFPSWLSSLITVLVFMVIISILVLGAGVLVLNESQNVYNMIVSKGNLAFVDSINASINKIMPQGMSFNLYNKLSDFIVLLANNIASIFTFTFSTIFYFLLTFLSIFYFLKDHKQWKRAIKVFSPLSDKDDQKIIDRLSLAVNGIIKGNLLSVFIQGILAGLGFFLFGVPNAALWGLVAVITSFIPTVGSGLVTVPIVIFFLITGHFVQAIGLFVWGVVILGTLGTLLNPIIIGNKINLHPVIILFSVLGGISIFGPIGILVGPLTISFLYTLISIYRNEFKEHIVSEQ